MAVNPEDKIVRGADLATIGAIFKAALDAKATVASYNVIETAEDGGINTLRITLTDGSQIEISTRNGRQGNPGSTQDYPFQLENTFSGGTNKALTAEMGKELYERHVSMTQAEYNALETKDPDVYYYLYED